MISVFNRAELFVDVSQEAAAKVWSTLKENGIEYAIYIDDQKKEHKIIKSLLKIFDK